MEKKDYEMFANTYKKVEAICTEIMNKLVCDPKSRDGYVYENDYIIYCENPSFESLIVDENNNVQFRWYDEDDDEDYLENIITVPKEVIIKENIDEWCENALAEHRRKVEERAKEVQARKEADERALYERLKRKYER